MPPLLLIVLQLLLFLNSRAVCAVTDLLGLPMHQTALTIIDYALYPLILLVFISMELNNVMSSSGEQGHVFQSGFWGSGSGSTTDLLHYCLILLFLVGSYTLGVFWDASLNMFTQLTDDVIHSTTLAVATVIPWAEGLAFSISKKLRGLQEYQKTVISTTIILASLVALGDQLVAHRDDILLCCLVAGITTTFVASMAIMVIGMAQFFCILASCIVAGYLKPAPIAPKTPTACTATNTERSVPSVEGKSCGVLREPSSINTSTPSYNDICGTGRSRCKASKSTSPKTRNSPDNNAFKSSTSSNTKSHGHARANSQGSSGSSKPSVIPSDSADQPSRPSTRTSFSEGYADHQPCLDQIRVLQMSRDILAAENVDLRAAKAEVSTENARLKSKNEVLRYQRFQTAENFQEHIQAMKHLEAANVELCLQLEHEHRLNLAKDAEFDERIQTFIRTNFPQFTDVANLSSPSSSSSCGSFTFSPEPAQVDSDSPTLHLSPASPSIAPGNAVLAKSLPAFKRSPSMASSTSSLSYTPPITPSMVSEFHLSPNSLIKRKKTSTASKGHGLKTPDAIAKFLGEKEYIPEKMAGPKTPATVSSGYSLPCPSETSYNSSMTISPAFPVYIKAKIGSGPGLPSPMPLATGRSHCRPQYAQPVTPATVSTSLTLPFSPPTVKSGSYDRVSVSSMIKPSHSRFFARNSSESPLAVYTADSNTTKNISGFATPQDHVRPQRFSNCVDFEDSPATVSSSSTLPIPSPGNNSSTCDPFV